jgi:alpha-glucosidase (family GH31 glycosyl hydrolase)
MGCNDVNVADPARAAVNGVFEYEYNETEDQAPKLANLRITHTRQKKVVWSSAPGVNFVGAAHVDLSVCERRDAKILTSLTSIQEHVLKTYNLQTIDSIERQPAHAITIRGQIGSEIVGGALEASAVDYCLVFYLVDHEGDCDDCSVGAVDGQVDGTNSDKALAFKLHITPTAKTSLVPNQTHLFGVTEESEAFFGFGHRLSSSNAKGMEVHVLNQSTDFSKGKQHKKSRTSSSCCAIPQFVTSHSRCMYLRNPEPSVFDLRSSDWFSVRVQCNAVSGVLIGGSDMLDVIRIYTSIRGRTKKLPTWTQRNGVILGISGGTDSVRTVVDRLHQTSCPISGVLIHDWSGVVDPSSLESRLWYNWILEREHYKYWHKLVAELDAAGINLGVYVNPMIEEIPVHLRSGRRYLFGEASREGYLIKSVQEEKKDKGHAVFDAVNGNKGEIYQMNKKKCPRVGYLDVSNNEACFWWKKVIHKEIMEYAGASFWMAGGGESAPIANAVYHMQATNGLAAHNLYSEDWARVNREAIRDAGREGDSFFLVEAGYGHTPKYAGVTSLEDQVVNYKSTRGGLQAVLNGLINGGFSGFTFGHCAVSFAVPRTVNSIDDRVREMIARWMEMNAFTCLFRTHDSDDGVSTVSAYNDAFLLRELSKWSTVYSLLADYRMKVSSEASYRGYPIVRHPILHFPLDQVFARSSVSSFMLGDSLYISPVMTSGIKRVKVYIPEGEWTHLWSDTPVTAPDNLGSWVEVKAPVGKPPVFYKTSKEMSQLVSNLRKMGMIRS